MEQTNKIALKIGGWLGDIINFFIDFLLIIIVFSFLIGIAILICYTIESIFHF